jgi:flagellin-like hook-associated protein FlgL
MSLSINTNVGALTALSVLNQTNKSLETTQARISSGFRVASAKDDAASYSIASKMRSDVAGFDAIKIGLGIGEATVGTAIKAAEAIKELLVEMKAKAVQAQGGGLTDDDRHALNDDVNKLQDQIDNIVRTAEFNDKNLIESDGDSMSVVADVSGESQIQINAFALDQVSLGLMLEAKEWSADADEDGNADNEKIGDAKEKDINTDELKKRYSYNSSKDLYYDGEGEAAVETAADFANKAKEKANDALTAANKLYSPAAGSTPASGSALNASGTADGALTAAVAFHNGTSAGAIFDLETVVGTMKTKVATALGDWKKATYDAMKAEVDKVDIKLAAAVLSVEAVAREASEAVDAATTAKLDAQDLLAKTTAAHEAAKAAEDTTAIANALTAKENAEASVTKTSAVFDAAVLAKGKADETKSQADKYFNNLKTYTTALIATVSPTPAADNSAATAAKNTYDTATATINIGKVKTTAAGLEGVFNTAKTAANELVNNTVAGNAITAQGGANTSSARADTVATEAESTVTKVANAARIAGTTFTAASALDELVKTVDTSFVDAKAALQTAFSAISGDSAIGADTQALIDVAVDKAAALQQSANAAYSQYENVRANITAAQAVITSAADAAGDDAINSASAETNMNNANAHLGSSMTNAKAKISKFVAAVGDLATANKLTLGDHLTKAATALGSAMTDAAGDIGTAKVNTAEILEDVNTSNEAAAKAAGVATDAGNQSESTAVTQVRDRVTMIDVTTGDKTAVNDVKESQKLIDAAIDKVTEALAYFGSVSKQLEIQKDFTQGLIDQLNIGIGTLVDADMAKESAMLQSLQIKQNLGTQALGIANAAPQTILGLFG